MKILTAAEQESKASKEIQKKFRSVRNALLIEADIEINKRYDKSLSVASWCSYRQALRDSTIDWVLPSKPQ